VISDKKVDTLQKHTKVKKSSEQKETPNLSAGGFCLLAYLNSETITE
jgi:hypothetical protein